MKRYRVTALGFSRSLVVVETVEELPEPMSAEECIAEIQRISCALTPQKWELEVLDVLSRYERSRG